MKTSALAAALVSIFNSAAEELEKLIAESGEEDGDEAPAESAKAKGARGSKAKDEEEEEENEDGDDEASEDDVVDAMKAALKVIDRAAVLKIFKKHGKADRATAVKPELRQAVIDALEAAVEDAG